jgi:hypothetical protein
MAEVAGELLRRLSASPTFRALKVRDALAMAVEAGAPELLAPDGSIDAQDLRAIVAASQRPTA